MSQDITEDRSREFDRFMRLKDHILKYGSACESCVLLNKKHQLRHFETRSDTRADTRFNPSFRKEECN